MKKLDMITSVIWLSIGIFVSLKAYRLDIGHISNPGSGFVFFWSGIILCLLSVIVFIKAAQLKVNKDLKKYLWVGLRWQRGLITVIGLFLYAYFFIWAGFLISTFSLLLFLFKMGEPQKWITSILLAGLIAFGAYGIFELLLKCQFPKGILSFW